MIETKQPVYANSSQGQEHASTMVAFDRELVIPSFLYSHIPPSQNLRDYSVWSRYKLIGMECR